MCDPCRRKRDYQSRSWQTCSIDIAKRFLLVYQRTYSDRQTYKTYVHYKLELREMGADAAAATWRITEKEGKDPRRHVETMQQIYVLMYVGRQQISCSPFQSSISARSIDRQLSSSSLIGDGIDSVTDRHRSLKKLTSMVANLLRPSFPSDRTFSKSKEPIHGQRARPLHVDMSSVQSVKCI